MSQHTLPHGTTIPFDGIGLASSRPSSGPMNRAVLSTHSCPGPSRGGVWLTPKGGNHDSASPLGPAAGAVVGTPAGPGFRHWHASGRPSEASDQAQPWWQSAHGMLAAAWHVAHWLLRTRSSTSVSAAAIRRMATQLWSIVKTVVWLVLSCKLAIPPDETAPLDL